MPMQPQEVRALLRAKGWTNADLAAHWGHGLTYISWLVNTPNERPRVYDDAFRGLPHRSSVQVHLEARHRRKRQPKRKWTALEMYPVGRVFVTQDSSLGPEEGTELVVTAVQPNAEGVLVTFEVCDGPGAGDLLEVLHGPQMDSLHDTGQDLAQRRAAA